MIWLQIEFDISISYSLAFDGIQRIIAETQVCFSRMNLNRTRLSSKLLLIRNICTLHIRAVLVVDLLN